MSSLEANFSSTLSLKNYHNPKDELPDVALALTKNTTCWIMSSFHPLTTRNIVRLKKRFPRKNWFALSARFCWLSAVYWATIWL